MSVGPIARALTEALRSAGPRRAQDAAARALARRLATLLDESAPRAAYTEPMLRVAAAVDAYTGDDAAEVARAWRRLTAALGQHSVASDLGPKYLATLTALGLTPASSTGGGVPSAGSKLDELRRRREQRSRQA